MNKAEQETIKKQLQDEETTLKYLKQVYKKAREDVEKQISLLNARTDLQNISTIVYQQKYQKAILGQINGVLEDLNKGQYKTLNDFFNGSYMNGYVGSMYELQKQGIPLTVPVDPKKVIRAIQTDSKLSERYYQERLFPENIQRLKLSIKDEISRSIASGKGWIDVANRIANGMNSPFNSALKDAIRIARTEGNRINQQGRLDSGDVAVQNGCDLLKQWDATMDFRTRPAHQEADGQIVEWNEKFIVGGEHLDAPCLGGSASNVINCRCQLLKKPRWALDEEELVDLMNRAEFFEIDKSDSFDEYMSKFLKLPKNADTVDIPEKVDINDSKTFADIRKYFLDMHNITIDSSIDSLDFNHVKEAMKGIDYAISRYEQMKDFVTMIGTDPTGYMCSDGRKVYFNPKYFGKGLPFNSNNAFQSGSHEVGHCIDLLLCRDKWLSIKENLEYVEYRRKKGAKESDIDRIIEKGAKEIWSRNGVSRGIVTKAINSFKKKNPSMKNRSSVDIRRTISNYATTTTAETVAEAIGNVCTYEHNGGTTGKSQWTLEDEIVDIIDGMMKGVK